MPVPQPPSSLDASCSVIHDDILYSYSPEAFLALPLTNGAAWKKLSTGLRVTGAVCVGSTPPDASQAAFFLVGGRAESNDYSGLQKFTYSTGRWETINLVDPVTRNRQWHAAHYIPADNVILLYAGSQGSSRGPSTQTFTIQASKPYTVQSYESAAPPAMEPFLMSWSDADVAMLARGHSPEDARIWLFNPTAHWRDAGASLNQPLPQDEASVQAALVDGEDRSKSLCIFDLGQSPNQVDCVVLQDAKGAPIHGSRRSWPAYNSSLAPTVTRSNFAFAQGSDGTMVFSGGGSGDSPLAIFKATENAWADPATVLGDPNQKLLLAPSTSPAPTTSRSSVLASSTPSTVSSTSSPTSLPTPSDTLSSTQTTSPGQTMNTELSPAQAPPQDTSNLGSDAILGITLGSIAAFLAMLGLLLLLLRRRKRRRDPSQANAALAPTNPSTDGKERHSLPPGYTLPDLRTRFHGHGPHASQDPHSSMAILGQSGGYKRDALPEYQPRESKGASFDPSHTASNPNQLQIAQAAASGQTGRSAAAPATSAVRLWPRNGPGEARGGARRSSGWNRYWSGGSALQILGFGAAKRSSTSSEQSLHRSGSRSGSSSRPSRMTQDSATVPPLHFEKVNFEGRPEVSSVNSGSPVVAQFSGQLPAEGMSGRIERTLSTSSSDGYSSGVPDSVANAWDPTTDGKRWHGARAPSSVYVPSYYGPTGGAQHEAGSRPPHPGVSSQPQLRTALTSSDMSWLNLGDRSRA